MPWTLRSNRTKSHWKHSVVGANRSAGEAASEEECGVLSSNAAGLGYMSSSDHSYDIDEVADDDVI